MTFLVKMTNNKHQLQTYLPLKLTIMETKRSKIQLSLIYQLPPEAQYEFRGELKGYIKRLNEESIAANEALPTGTDPKNNSLCMIPKGNE